MKLYSHKGDYPSVLPNRIVLPNGFTRTDRTTYTEEEIYEAGYVEVPSSPNFDFPNRLDWDSETLQWIILPPSEEQINIRRTEIQEECKKRLFETDYKVIKSMELNQPLSHEYVKYRAALRDLYNNIVYMEPWDVEIPSLFQFLDSEPLKPEPEEPTT